MKSLQSKVSDGGFIELHEHHISSIYDHICVFSCKHDFKNIIEILGMAYPFFCNLYFGVIKKTWI